MQAEHAEFHNGTWPIYIVLILLHLAPTLSPLMKRKIRTAVYLIIDVHGEFLWDAEALVL